MTCADRPDEMDASATLVFDMMMAVSRDPAINVELLEGNIEHDWVIASLFNTLSASALDIDMELVQVRTCNYPLEQYDNDLTLPSTNYRCCLYLRAGNWLFDSNPFLAPKSQADWGFAGFPSTAAALEREKARWFKPYETWHHEVAPPRGACYTSTPVPALVDRAIKAPLALHLAKQMDLATPCLPVSNGCCPRF